jgi:Stress responsive A/B Barrel Domain
MIRHVVMFTWNEHATDKDKRRALDELATLPDIVPSVGAFAVGADTGVNEGNYDFAVTADFDNLNGYLAYRDDPAHRAMVSAYILPVTGKRAAVQFEYTG